jgi:cytochrome c5
MKNYVIVTAMIILASCSAAKFVPTSLTQADADRLSARYPGLTVEELNEGKLHYEMHCSTCHGLKNPVKWNEIKWKSIVPDMAAKANKKAKKEVVDQAIQESILKYVIAVSTGGKKAS